jgi:tRNA A37 N6-isopentenylltransferase MiaA
MDSGMVEAARARLRGLPEPSERRFPAMLIESSALLVERAVSAQAEHRADPARPAPGHEDVAAALTLVEDLRDLLERLEAQVVQLAKARQMTWPQIAAAQDQRSPQAATQRHQRLVTRLVEREGFGHGFRTPAGGTGA